MPRKRPVASGEPSGLGGLEIALEHRFVNRDLLERAVVHRSHAHERGTPGVDSEPLEFLGDAVLSLGVSWMLYRRFDQAEVGELSRARAHLVSETSLARAARARDLGRHLKLGRGEEKDKGREKDSLLADAYEAVLGALYLDGGMAAAMGVIERDFSRQIARLRPGGSAGQDFKTRLQEALQAAGLPVPKYVVAAESGPPHRKIFSIDLTVSGRAVSRGVGPSKKVAEQTAARRAFRRLDRLIPELIAQTPA